VIVIPSIDLTAGRSRLVWWPGASTGSGAPTDRPEVIAARLVDAGARQLHLVDFEGARAGRPENLDPIARIAERVAVPLQVAGGLESADAIRLAFAAGATRAVLSLAIADRPDDLRECLAVAGDWLAVGLDPRPERLAAFPWQRDAPPTPDGLLGELMSAGVRRFVLSHGGSQADVARLAALAATYDAEFLVAGGVTDLAALRRLREAGVAGVILGEPLFSGAIDLPAALETAA
jgi:phosphoribosylformimino-5-aminoimidazole carboxamide ribotide isomerase